MKNTAKAFFMALFLLAGTAEAVADTFLGSGTWTAPTGVTSVTVEAWGGGGAGGGATSNTGPFKGGGGAGGQYSKKVVAVTPLAVYTIVVGAGGTGSTGSGTAGGDSTFGGAQVVAKGGAGGISYELGGAAGLGSTVNGVGDIVYKGGDGSAGGATAVGGAGGGGAGSTGAGGNASGNAAGTGTASGGGNGAAGLTAMGDGTAGFVAGGGGSGGYVTSNFNRSGGAGAAGMVIVSYVAAPSVTTAAATALTATGATLNGTVSSNGVDTAVSFEYGLTVAYGSSIGATPPTVLGTTTSATPVSAAVTGLTCNTLYHFRVKGVSNVTSYGNDLTFTTSACLPPVTVTPATGGGAIASNTAPGCSAEGTWTTLTGPVIPETVAGQIGIGDIVLSAPAGFEFNTAAPVTIFLGGAGSSASNINNLTRNNSYPVTAINSAAITFNVFEVSASANTLTWQGIQVRPTASTPLATGNITHAASPNISGVTTTTNFGTLTEVASTPACRPAPTVTGISPASGPTTGGTVVNITGTNFTGATAVTIGGVAATGITVVTSTTITATTPAGTAGAKDVVVTTPWGTGTGTGLFTYVAVGVPTATTNIASNLYTENGADWFATLNGMVSSNGASTTVTFEYGLDTNYGLTIPLPTDPPITLVSGAANSAVSADLIGLICNTTFHYRVVATNSYGTSYGSDSTFTTGACTAPLFGATDCAATRYGSDLSCGAQDVSLTDIAISPGSVSACTSGTPVTLDLDFIVNFSSPSRYDVGIFVAKDGKSPTLLPANGGAASCTVGVLPITPQPAPYTQFPDLDGATVGIPGDICGDGSNALSGVVRLSNVTLPCYASPVSAGQLYVPYVVSWDNQPSPVGGVCSSNQFPVPNSKSRCSVPPGTVNIAVVVMPKINKTHSGTSFNTGDPVTYTITVFNDSGGTLQQSTLTDPAVTGLAVSDSGVTCATLNGSTCPTATKALIQGAGIVIPSANLPNNSSLIFTVTGNLSGSIGDTIHNTANITIGSNTNSSTDSITLGSASGSKSFSPASVTEGNSSLMTITFTNPTASPVGGVSFSDTYPSGLVNAAIPTPSTTCGGTPTATAGGNTLTFDAGTIPASGSCTVSVYVTSATANSYVNSVSFTPGSLGSASATLAVTAVTTGNFNAFETGTAAGAITGIIMTKIAGNPFSLDVVAIKNGAQDNAFSKTVKVELLGNTTTGIPLDANNCPTSATLLQTVTPNPSLSNGRGVVNFAAVNDAWRDVRVRITYPLTAPPVQTIACSTDNFAIRPDSLNGLAVKHSDWANPGTGAVSDTALNNLSHAVTGTPNVHKAGRNFHVSATAVNAVLATTINYTGSPTAVLTSCALGATCTVLGTNCACTLTTGGMTLPGSAASGIYSTVAATYNEVGALNLQLQDTTFAAVDTSDTSGDCTLGGRYVCSQVLEVGRFVPDHFALAYNMPAFDGACSGGFTYIGQTFNYATAPEITVEAQNSANATTALYTGNWWRITNASLTGKSYTTASGALDISGITGSDPTISNTGGGVGTLTFSSGTGLFFTRDVTAPPVAPFDAEIGLAINIIDADGVAFAGNPASFGAATLGNGIDFINGKHMRFGRLRLSNAFGSEKSDLAVLVQAHYWSGNSWVLNSADSCTSLNTEAFFLSGALAGSTNASAVALIGGQGTLTLAAPILAATGSVDVAANLGTSGSDQSCLPSHGGTAANLPWLRSRNGSCAATYDRDPSARATFGIYAPETRRTIHIREQF